MKFQITKEGVYVPSFNRNGELSATEQVTVRYRVPTLAIKNRCRSKPQGKSISGPDGRIEKIEITVERDELAT
jgi:hypothetical protein